MSQLGLVTKEITMSLGNGNDLGYVTNEITMSLGAADDQSPAPPLSDRNWNLLWGVLSIGSAVASGFHGYYRHDRSAGAAAGWAILGLLFPVITPAVALAQGFGQPRT